jgi:ABC-type phosphate transport system substrate-binding protein
LFETQYPDIRQFPFLAGANVLVYNIPELPIAQWNLGHRVVLSRSSFVGIFNSSITQWNDPRILADQTSTVVRDVLSNLTAWIKPIIRSDGSGTTTITLQTMANIEPNFLKSPNALNGSMSRIAMCVIIMLIYH